MRTGILFIVALVLLSAVTMAQTAAYKVIFDITSGDTAAQKTVIRNCVVYHSPAQTRSWKWPFTAMRWVW